MNFFYHEQEDEQVMAEINVTPLVDVMLVLLIVFMITMPVLTYTISINLPSTSIEDPVKQVEEPLRLTIDEQGKYFLSDKPLSLDEFSRIVESKVQANADTVLAISADKQVNYDFVVKALETAQKAGIKKIGFVTEDKK